MVLGESGSGKSALIANWARKYREGHPDDFMVFHYIGGTADSADYAKILRRIMEEIQARYEPKEKGRVGDKERPLSIGTKEDEIPTDPKKVVEQFPLWLAKAAARGRFILVLDALNQLEDKDNAPDLGWLPHFFPGNVRVILSTLTAEKERGFTAEGAEGAKEQAWRRQYEALKKRGWQTVHVELLTREERKRLIEGYLARFARKLSTDAVDKIIAAQQTANPLYLKALLDELRVYGDHDTLGQRIDHYLQAGTIDALYEKILERYEGDYEHDRKGLVRDVMSHIWASRRGLSEAELRELLGKENEPMPRAYWSPLYLAAEESLVSRSGLLSFFHDYLRKAVEDKYLRDKEQKRLAHLRLADYFDKRALDARKADELPWQLMQTEKWERLKDCITNIPMFVKLMTDATKYELMGYWLAMGDRFDMVESYNIALYTALSRWEQTQGRVFLRRFMVFLRMIIPSYFWRMLPTLTLPWDQTRSSVDTVPLDLIADFLYLNAKYTGAEPLFRMSLAIREKLLGKKHPATATSLTKQALLLCDKGDFADAEALFLRALAINEKVLGKEHPATATGLNNLALVLQRRGDCAGAEPLFRRALAIDEKVLGKEHPATVTTLNNLAAIFYYKKDYAGAEPIYHNVLAICKKVFGQDHPYVAATLFNLANLFCAKGRYKNAEPLYREALAIREKVLKTGHPDIAQSLNGLALLRQRRGDYADAEALFRRALAIREKALGKEHPDTATSLENLAQLLQATNRLAEAEPLSRSMVEIFLQFTRETGHPHPHLNAAVNNYAGLLQAMGRSADDIRSDLKKLGQCFGVNL